MGWLRGHMEAAAGERRKGQGGQAYGFTHHKR